MGKGDRKTAKGKRFSKSFGKSRTKKSKDTKAGTAKTAESK